MNAWRIAALDEPARRLGLRRGMGVADARAMHPSIEVVEADEEADCRLLEGLADWCGRYTPLVALDPPDGLFLDVTGCTHLFGGEQALLDDVFGRFSSLGFDVRAGVAATPGMAWAAARFRSGALIPAGTEADHLAPLPLAALRIDRATRTRLEGLGLYTAGAMMKLPRGPLARRFGRHLLQRLDQALGRLEEAISPRLPASPLSVERRLAEPVTTAGEIEELAFLLACRLRSDLERRGEGARALELALFRVDGAVRRLAVGLSQATRDPAIMRRLWRERLGALEGSLDPGYGFDLVRLCATATAPFAQPQAELATVGADAGVATDDLTLLADRIAARLGRQAVRRPALLESHIPEHAAAFLPFPGLPFPSPALGQGEAADGGPECERPIRLFAMPEPVEVPATELPEGPPLRFRWRNAFHDVVRAEGPERILPEWWRETGDRPRDYFRLEDKAGRRYWIFRQGLYRPGEHERPRWFMHGLFA